MTDHLSIKIKIDNANESFRSSGKLIKKKMKKKKE